MPDTDRIKFTRTDGLVTITAGATELARSPNTVILKENSYPPRLYFPVENVNMDVLQITDTSTRCPYKGVAEYFSATTSDGVLEDIAWTYNNPIAEAAEIKGLIAFYEEKLSVSGK